MASGSDIKVVVIHAAGYSGATWVNLVLGSHQSAMALGPISRIHELGPADASHACFVHGEDCTVWPEFLREERPAGRFLLDLSDLTGKRIFLLNYSTDRFYADEIASQDFDVKHIRLVRDGRANLYSKIRHDSINSPSGTLESILKWQVPKFLEINSVLPVDPQQWHLLRYEDLLHNSHQTLLEVGNFLGLQYEENATRFWEFEHHLTAGNTGVIDTLRQIQGEAGLVHHRDSVYATHVAQLRRDSEATFTDDEWCEGFDRWQLLAFDCLFGAVNESLGYQRDLFSAEEQSEFWRMLGEWEACQDRLLAHRSSD